MKNSIKLIFALALLTACMSKSKVSSPEDQFIDQLLGQMTLTEKVGQLHQITSQWEMTGPAPNTDDGQFYLQSLKSGKIGSMLNVTGADATRKAQEIVVENSRLGIPLIFGYDVIHGYQTMFPLPLAEAASWDPDLLELSASVQAKETAAAGIHWTFAPMMDVGRDARWGRVMEGAGEDPYLASVLSVARVRGFQGNDLADELTIAACAKHFAGYAFAEAGRDYNTVDISNSTLHNVILPPFKASAEAGAATFMNSFNIIQGTPATANKYIQRDLLKEDWRFDGFIVSDWNSIGEIQAHGAANDLKEAAKLALNAGSDMDMEGRAYTNHLETLVKEGKVDQQLIDDAVRRVLRIKYRLGLFDDPYKYSDSLREVQTLLNQEHRQAARKVARESMVLLKNENNMLPLSKDIKSIAVIGPFADDTDNALGNWRAQAIAGSAVSLLSGVKEAVSAKTKVTYSKGCDLVISERTFFNEIKINTTDRSGFSDAIQAARSAEVVLLAIGEDCYQTGEARSQSDIGLKGLQKELFDEIYKVNRNIVVVLTTGRPVTIPEIAGKAPAILEAWIAGSEAGNAIADVLFGEYNPSGKLPMTFPRSAGQLPIYYSRMNTGRPGPMEPVFWSHYTDLPNTPLYPFGYGLSYTSFEYSDLKTDNSVAGTIKVTVKVKNTGDIAGQEVAQLYIRDKVASLPRPIKELKGFQKISLEPGKSEVLEFVLGSQDLGFYDNDGVFKVESGEFDIMVGTNSADLMTVTTTLNTDESS